MRIAVFGSTGAVGTHVVRRALEREWDVVAFARTPSKLGELRERVEVVQGDVQDPSSFGRTVMLTIMQLVAGTMLDDAQRHTDMIRRTGLDWTVVRPPRLTDEPYTGEWHAGYMKLGPTSKMGREDLAEFMLQQVESDEWISESPMVANA